MDSAYDGTLSCTYTPVKLLHGIISTSILLVKCNDLENIFQSLQATKLNMADFEQRAKAACTALAGLQLQPGKIEELQAQIHHALVCTDFT